MQSYRILDCNLNHSWTACYCRRQRSIHIEVYSQLDFAYDFGVGRGGIPLGIVGLGGADAGAAVGVGAEPIGRGGRLEGAGGGLYEFAIGLGGAAVGFGAGTGTEADTEGRVGAPDARATSDGRLGGNRSAGWTTADGATGGVRGTF